MVKDSIKTHGLIELLYNFGVGVLEMSESLNVSSETIRKYIEAQEGK